MHYNSRYIYRYEYKCIITVKHKGLMSNGQTIVFYVLLSIEAPKSNVFLCSNNMKER